MLLFVLFCDAPGPRFSATITAVATFIAARIRTSCSVNPRAVIFHITASQRDRSVAFELRQLLCQTERVHTTEQNEPIGASSLTQHCRKLNVSRAHRHQRRQNRYYRRSRHSIGCHPGCMPVIPRLRGEGSIFRSARGSTASLSLIHSPTCARMEAGFISITPELL